MYSWLGVVDHTCSLGTLKAPREDPVSQTKTEKRPFLEQFVELLYLVIKCCPRQPAAWKANYVLRIKCPCESLSCSFQVPRPMPWDSHIFGWPSSWRSQCAYCLLLPSASYQWPSGHQKAIRYIKIHTWSPPTWVPLPGTKAFPSPTFPADFSVRGKSDQNFIALLYLFNSILKESEPSCICPYSIACFAFSVLQFSQHLAVQMSWVPHPYYLKQNIISYDTIDVSKRTRPLPLHNDQQTSGPVGWAI